MLALESQWLRSTACNAGNCGAGQQLARAQCGGWKAAGVSIHSAHVPYHDTAHACKVHPGAWHNATYTLGCCLQYMCWAGIPPSQEDTFWTNPTVRSLIKNAYKVLVTRKNTFNGKLYGEDTTIFSWDIYNVRASLTCVLPAHRCMPRHSCVLWRTAQPVSTAPFAYGDKLYDACGHGESRAVSRSGGCS